MGLVLPGASQPAVAAALGLDLVESGLLASALSLGLGIGVVAAGPAVDRLPRRPLFCGAVLFGAAGVVFLPGLGSYAAVFGAVLVLGLGCGVFETVLNTLIPERDPARAASRLAVAHAAATGGAALGAAVLGATIASQGWEKAWLGIGVLYVGLALYGAGVRMPAPPHGPPSSDGGSEAGPRLWPAVLPFALAAACYVGIETALTVFLPPLVADAGLDVQRGSLAISAFWGGLFVSRLGFAAVTRGTNVRILAGCGVAGALLLAGAPWARAFPEAWALGVGLALGPVFPLLVAAGGQRFAQVRGTATGLVVGAGSLGGAAMPWAVGALGEATDVVWAVTSLCVASLGVVLGSRR